MIDIGQMLDIWEEKEYPSDEARYISYFEDLQGLLEQYDPCAHHGQKCDEVHPNQSHEECIEVTINNALYEATQKKLNEMKPLALRMAIRRRQQKHRDPGYGNLDIEDVKAVLLERATPALRLMLIKAHAALARSNAANPQTFITNLRIQTDTKNVWRKTRSKYDGKIKSIC